MSKKEPRELTVAELEALIVEKRAVELAEIQKEKKEYEKKRDKAVVELATLAKDLSFWLTQFGRDAREAMETQKNELEKYGKIRANSKGGFQLVSADGKFKVVYQYKAISSYDERADKAETLLKDFLNDTIKKKDLKMHGIIMSLLERNGKGQLEYARVQSLYKFENDYDDQRWKEAIKLFKESFTVTASKMQIYFHERNEKGEYEPINLNFSSL
jgi:hypothetical protein